MAEVDYFPMTEDQRLDQAFKDLTSADGRPLFPVEKMVSFLALAEGEVGFMLSTQRDPEVLKPGQCGPRGPVAIEWTFRDNKIYLPAAMTESPAFMTWAQSNGYITGSGPYEPAKGFGMPLASKQSVAFEIMVEEYFKTGNPKPLRNWAVGMRQVNIVWSPWYKTKTGGGAGVPRLPPSSDDELVRMYLATPGAYLGMDKVWDNADGTLGWYPAFKNDAAKTVAWLQKQTGNATTAEVYYNQKRGVHRSFKDSLTYIEAKAQAYAGWKGTPVNPA